MSTIRENLTSTQRATDLDLIIDPGFVHHRKIQTILGKTLMNSVDAAIHRLPDMPEWQKEVRIDHIYSEAMLLFCKSVGVRPLQYNLAINKGELFCSVEKLGPCEDIYEKDRTISKWLSPQETPINVEFHYSTKHIHSDTVRSRLHQGNHEFAIIAQLYSFQNNLAIFEPLIIGAPWLKEKKEQPDFDIMWYSYEFFEDFIEDFDEFQKAAELPIPESCDPMKDISERAFKICLSEILKEKPSKDWGGETSDFYTSHIHLKGKRTTSAFLLKGPARFAPMTLNHLGKNNDQIVRLAKEPAQVLFIQHCHDVTTPVRETLRAFAVQPGNPRRYCIIDGKDSLRLLKAYNLFDRAIELSKK